MDNGYYKLNTSALRVFTKAFEVNPAGDLEEMFRQVYTLLMNEGEIVELSQSPADREINPSPDKRVPVPQPQPRTTILPELLSSLSKHVRTASRIDSPLSPRLLTLLAVNSDAHTATEVAESLLRILHNREPLAVSGHRVIVLLDEDVIVKLGRDLGTDEFALLHLLYERVPTVNAPRTLGYMTIGPVSCMFMMRLPGDTLKDRWPTLDMQKKQAVRTLLGPMFSSLRAIHPHQYRAHRFCNELQFNEILIHSDTSRASSSYRRWVLSMLRQDHHIVLTHGDLHPGNILVDIVDTGGVAVGLIDWEMGGFYPEYWEMLEAMNTRDIRDSSDWWEYLPQTILGYDQEIAIDRLLENSLLA
ncbi:hypothetical protein FISHEDRAFT_58816 [Fistulina hepatica ATCC 64428]|uniref:Aminoglycoside phosphotransferase domain-containing protein n=1 Tax=Fistulina hepatica ATCC 64428 TaxID=1128425 RepID=A0A0D7ADN8_9AGAR|nr:hypothetical protein FISHEDRAFT_58816 [Fistulina hepatica ATCC 64428]